MHCELLDLERTVGLSYRISRAIWGEGFRPDLIVAIARGGLVPARFIGDVLGVSTIVSMTVRHYGAGAQVNDGAYVAHPVNADISGLRVLLVDDVNDTGDTFATALPHVLELGPAEVRTAVLHEKEVSTFRADFIGETLTEWRWLIYPWAIMEDLSSFVARLLPSANSRNDIKRQLESHYGLSVEDERLDLALLTLGTEGARFLR